MTDNKWDISHEREYIETLLNTRFNFFLLFFSLVITGAVTARTQLHLILVLAIGAVITTMFLSVLWHTQEKVDRTIDIVLDDESHPATQVDKACNSKTKRVMLGKWIPLVCVVILWLGTVLALCGSLEHAA